MCVLKPITHFNRKWKCPQYCLCFHNLQWISEVFCSLWLKFSFCKLPSSNRKGSDKGEASQSSGSSGKINFVWTKDFPWLEYDGENMQCKLCCSRTTESDSSCVCKWFYKLQNWSDLNDVEFQKVKLLFFIFIFITDLYFVLYSHWAIHRDTLQSSITFSFSYL